MFFLLAARPDTYDIQEQPPAIAYTDRQGRPRTLLADLSTETTIASLVEASRLQGRGFRAAFRAIYAGLARPLVAGVILPSTLITAGVAQ